MIRINDLVQRLQKDREPILNAVRRVIDRGWLVLGPEVEEFERAFAAYLGTEHCVGVANGTDAIQLGLTAAGVSQGDLVATAANAGMYTTSAAITLGAEPLFLDVESESQCISLSEVRRGIDAGVKAIVITHLYGQAAPDIEEIAVLCEREGVFLLEDCAQAHGARIGTRHVGTFGNAASFSFYPTKNLGALGDGGAIVTKSPEIAEKVRTLRQYGWTTKYRVELPNGRNSRLDEIQAAILHSVFLPNLEMENERRRAVARRYDAGVMVPSILKPRVYGPSYVAHLYVVRTKHRSRLQEHLAACNVASDIHYPIPDHMQPIWNGRFDSVKLPITEDLAQTILTLPCHPWMTDDDVDRVIESVNGFTD